VHQFQREIVNLGLQKNLEGRASLVIYLQLLNPFKNDHFKVRYIK